MAIRISCPSCEASLSFDDDKRGKKVRCKKCEETFTLNGKAKESEAAIQDGRKVKTKAASKAGDDDDDRPAKKKKPEPKKGGMGIILVLGGVAAVVLLLCVGVIGGGALLFMGGRSASTPDDDRVAKKTEPEPRAEVKKEPEQKKEPEPKKEPEKKKDPELKKEPEKKKDPEPKTGPPPLSAELQKVKQATVFLSAQMLSGRRYEGSGFLVLEDGIVVTNAHVLGMLDGQAPPPVQIMATMNPGEPSEVKTLGIVLAVDRTVDLVVLRIAAPVLPAPLMFEDSAKVMETQAVHVAAHPVESKTRKDFTITPTAIARLKKAPTGRLDEVQVGAGISSATSGGPVVTSAGMVVGINAGDDKARLATPADVIKRFLDGGIGAATIDKIKAGKVPVAYSLSDPLKRIKEVRVDVWTGGPGPNRPYSYMQPAPLPGDGARNAQPLLQQKASASGDVTLPAAIPNGQVVWLQPVIVLKDNTMHWGVATSVTPPPPVVVVKPPPPSPYELKAANLFVKLQNPKERTVRLDAVFKTNLKKAATTSTIHAIILESMGPDPEGALMRTSYGVVNEIDGQNVLATKQTLDLVRLIPTSYSIDPTNKVGAKRLYRSLDQKLPKEPKDSAQALQYHIGTAYEAGIMPMPNRSVKPGETWNTNYGVVVHSKKATAEAFLTLQSTFQGFLVRNKRNEAIITVAGKLQVLNNPQFKFLEGNVTGTVGFDEAGGYLSSTQLKITNAGDTDTFTLDIDIKRMAGNPGNIQLVQDIKQPDPKDPKDAKDPKDGKDPKDAKARVVLDQKGFVVPGPNVDPKLSDAKKKKLAYKTDVVIQMQVGKNYTITVTNAAFDSHLKLVTQAGQMVAEHGGQGNNSKITYRAPATGAFFIQIISLNGKTGGFHIHVTESP